MKFEYALSINSTEIMSDTKKAIQPHNGCCQHPSPPPLSAAVGTTVAEESAHAGIGGGAHGCADTHRLAPDVLFTEKFVSLSCSIVGYEKVLPDGSATGGSGDHFGEESTFEEVSKVLADTSAALEEGDDKPKVRALRMHTRTRPLYPAIAHTPGRRYRTV